jgi:nanoRNase/pAp phosphatase (c-di-AMP/oligoRNAs hydrolase)
VSIDTLENLFNFVSDKQKILITLPERVSVDHIASGVVLSNLLRKYGKNVSLVCSGDIPHEAEFLLTQDQITNKLVADNQYTIILKTINSPLEQLSYEAFENEVKIYLKPKSGGYHEEDISFVEQNTLDFDVIICIGMEELAELGELFISNPDLFYNIPKINLDTSPKNTLFGLINIVKVGSSGSTEVLADYLLNQSQEEIDKSIATALFAGLSWVTHSFQNIKTTPKLLDLASNLITKDAEHMLVVHQLFKTRGFNFLRLWGRLLARLKTLGTSHIIYSILFQSDFQKTDTNETDLLRGLFDALDNMNEIKTLLVLAELKPKEWSVLAASGLGGVDLTNIANKLNTAPNVITGDYSGFNYALLPITATTDFTHNKLLGYTESR